MSSLFCILLFAAVTLFCVGMDSAFGWPMAYHKIAQSLLSGVSAQGMGPVSTALFGR